MRIGTLRACSRTRLNVSSPLESGSERSSSATSKGSASSFSSASDRRVATATMNVWLPPKRSASRTRRASPGLSSIRRTLTPAAVLFTSVGGQLHDRKPKVLDRAHDLEELSEVDGLGDVAVGVEVVALDDVLLRLR